MSGMPMQGMPMPGMQGMPNMQMPNTQYNQGQGSFSQPNQSTELFIGNLAPDVDDQLLYGIFSKYGTISNLFVKKDHITKESRFSFVKFQTRAMAENARENANHLKIKSRQIRVKWKSENKAPMNQEANLFVNNIDTNITEKDFELFFAKFGLVASAIIKTDYNGDSLGYGYVQFKNVPDAKKCITNSNGENLGERKLQV